MTLKIKSLENVVLLNLFLIFVLTSCSTSKIAQYPKSWKKSALIYGESCANISGTYENEGIDAPSNKDVKWHQKHPIFLSNFFTDGPLVNGYKQKWITHIKFSEVKGKKLTAEFYKKEKLIYSKIFVIKEDFLCTTEGIVFESSYNKVYEIGGGFGHRVTKLIFTKTKDNSLLLTKDFSEKGLALVLVPFSEKVVSLYKFNRAKTKP